MPRQNRTLRTLRGGGTVSWSFAPASHVMNNPVAWRSETIEGGVRSMPSVASHGLPMRGGGYGFDGSNGLAGGMAATSSTHCQRGGRANKKRRTSKQNAKQKKSKTNKRSRNRNRSN